MTKELVQEYTLRISQASRTQIIVIMYEMAERYISDAQKSHNSGDYEEFLQNLKAASRVIVDLEASVDMKYELAAYLLKIYQLIQKKISEVIIKKRDEGLDKVLITLQKLRESFEEVAKQYDNEPVMGNAQSVYAGLTYAKGNLVENVPGSSSRGFSV